MVGENLNKLFQLAGAALGVPAAAVGTIAAYQSYFSSDETCQKLRSNILATMERSVTPETKRSLLKKDVTDFDRLCGAGDPDARALFHAALEDPVHLAATDAAPAASAAAPAAPAAAPPEPPRPQALPVGVFGAPGSKDHYGWVALSHRQADGAWVVHFNGHAISDTSLPPSGTVLSAQRMLPVWSEPQAGTNDQTKMQSRLPAGACVRVVATRGGISRLWAEVAPASCS
jgi:hypothetical protein